MRRAAMRWTRLMPARRGYVPPAAAGCRGEGDSITAGHHAESVQLANSRGISLDHQVGGVIKLEFHMGGPSDLGVCNKILADKELAQSQLRSRECHQVDRSPWGYDLELALVIRHDEVAEPRSVHCHGHS